jgi:hypothetical protein
VCPSDCFYSPDGEVACGEDAADPSGLGAECIAVVMDDVKALGRCHGCHE